VSAVSEVVGVVSQAWGAVSHVVGVVSQAVVAEAVAAAAVSVVGVEPMMLIHRAGGQLNSVLGQASVLGVAIRGHTLDACHAESAVVSTTVGTGRQLPPLSSVLYGIISGRRSVLAA